MIKQYTIKVEGFVTITAEEPLNIENVPIKIDVFTKVESEISDAICVIETDITEKTITSETNL
jgi:hypothetical protein